MAVRAYLGLGSNLGDRLENLQAAVDALAAAFGIRLLRSSSVYETAPVGGPPQPHYLNAAIEIETDLSARDLLRECQRVELGLGRDRAERWGPRTIDIDILTYGDERILLDDPPLEIPHPRMHERAFVLIPLGELTGRSYGGSDDVRSTADQIRVAHATPLRPRGRNHSAIPADRTDDSGSESEPDA